MCLYRTKYSLLFGCPPSSFLTIWSKAGDSILHQSLTRLLKSVLLQAKDAAGDAAGSAKSATGDVSGSAKSAAGDVKGAAQSAGRQVDQATPDLSANPFDNILGKVSCCITSSAELLTWSATRFACRSLYSIQAYL